MKNSLCVMMLLTMLGLFSAAQAETVYVAERIRLGLRAEVAETGAVVKTIETGAPLEVIERLDRFVQVRDAQGVEGWIEARYLSPDPPARLQLVKLEEELTKSRAQTAEAQAQLKKAQAALTEQSAKIKELEKETAEKPAMPLTPNPPTAPTPVTAPPGKPSKETDISFSFLWLGISFAMLGIGFAAGIKWLRESIRKRSGGMYLRV